MQRRLGCLSTGAIGAATLALLLIAAVAVGRGGRLFSPGPLNAQLGDAVRGQVRSHAETGGHCAACHPAPWSKDHLADRCLACHDEIDAELHDPASLHGILDESAQARECHGCHTEHRGADGELTRVDAAAFPHHATGYALDGHQANANGAAFACADCHDQGIAVLDQAVCLHCHRELDAGYAAAHAAAFGEDCLACHDGLDTYGERFDHNQASFLLAGRHAAVDCAACHPGARSIADLQAAPQDCYACHREDDAHGGRFGQDCGGCHNAEGWEQATFDHAQTAFPLAGKHAAVECAGCHANDVFQGTDTECVACHREDDAHDGQFGQDCGGCHNAEGWEQATFDHARTAFPLTGKHAAVECAGCHANDVFQGTATACVACHREDDAHDGRFGEDCGGCHNTEDWAQATFDHAQTAFPLTGKHAAVECAGCHKNDVFQGTPAQCVACHDDPAYHAGLFGVECQDCHTADGWSPARFDRPHGFPIAHGESGPSTCRTCHPDNLQTYTCYGCHEHQPAEIAAQHQEEGIADFRDCVRCHPTGQEEEGGED